MRRFDGQTGRDLTRRTAELNATANEANRFGGEFDRKRKAKKARTRDHQKESDGDVEQPRNDFPNADGYDGHDNETDDCWNHT